MEDADLPPFAPCGGGHDFWRDERFDAGGAGGRSGARDESPAVLRQGLNRWRRTNAARRGRARYFAFFVGARLRGVDRVAGAPWVDLASATADLGLPFSSVSNVCDWNAKKKACNLPFGY